MHLGLIALFVAGAAILLGGIFFVVGRALTPQPSRDRFSRMPPAPDGAPRKVELRSDDVTPGVVFVTDDPRIALRGLTPPLPERQVVQISVGARGTRSFLTWVPDAEAVSRLSTLHLTELEGAPVPPIWTESLNAKAAAPQFSERTIKVLNATTNSREAKRIWDLHMDPRAFDGLDPALKPIVDRAIALERSIGLRALRSVPHAVVPNFSPAALADLLSIFDLNDDPRPAAVGAHAGIPIQLFEIPDSMTERLVSASRSELDALLETWIVPPPHDDRKEAAWALSALVGLAQAARAQSSTLYVLFDEEL